MTLIPCPVFHSNNFWRHFHSCFFFFFYFLLYFFFFFFIRSIQCRNVSFFKAIIAMRYWNYSLVKWVLIVSVWGIRHQLGRRSEHELLNATWMRSNMNLKRHSVHTWRTMWPNTQVYAFIINGGMLGWAGMRMRMRYNTCVCVLMYIETEQIIYWTTNKRAERHTTPKRDHIIIARCRACYVIHICLWQQQMERRWEKKWEKSAMKN